MYSLAAVRELRGREESRACRLQRTRLMGRALLNKCN